LENCLNTASVATDWQFRAAKRAVIKAALRRISAGLANSVPKASDNSARGGEERRHFSQHNNLNSAIFRSAFLRLNPFQRAMLLLRRYEGFSAGDAALLLGVSRQILENGLRQALSALLEILKRTQACELIIIGTADDRQREWKRESARIPA
jgi:DNA-directed RNA polymerase specialized sigma24 family protein